MSTSSEPAPSPPTSDEDRAPRIGADWAAVIVAAVLVLLAVIGLLPAIPFLVK
ncbi:MAG TPA: hypothetical protein VGE11_15805 [Pseudonocardia sp.]